MREERQAHTHLYYRMNILYRYRHIISALKIKNQARHQCIPQNRLLGPKFLVLSLLQARRKQLRR